MADVYGALTEDRPYREGLAHEVAFGILAKEAPQRIDAECLEALHRAVEYAPGPEPACASFSEA